MPWRDASSSSVRIQKLRDLSDDHTSQILRLLPPGGLEFTLLFGDGIAKETLFGLYLVDYVTFLHPFGSGIGITVGAEVGAGRILPYILRDDASA